MEWSYLSVDISWDEIAADRVQERSARVNVGSPPASLRVESTTAARLRDPERRDDRLNDAKRRARSSRPTIAVERAVFPIFVVVGSAALQLQK